MEKLIFVGAALATLASAGMMRVAFLRRPPTEPFEPTGKERTRLALYQRPERWFLQHLKRPRVVVDGQTLDAKFQYMIEQAGNPDTAARLMRWLFATAPGRAWVRAQADRHWNLFAKVTAPMRRVEDRTVPGRGGPIPIRIYWPQTTSQEPLPILVYYPAVGLPHDDRSFTLFGKGYGLDASFFDYLLARLFPGAVIGLDVPDDLMGPLHAKSLAGLPPTLVATAGFDILRDSGAAFAERLRTGGVPVVYRNYPSLTHSFLQFSGVIADADRAATETARLFGEAIRQPGHDFSCVRSR